MVEEKHPTLFHIGLLTNRTPFGSEIFTLSLFCFEVAIINGRAFITEQWDIHRDSLHGVGNDHVTHTTWSVWRSAQSSSVNTGSFGQLASFGNQSGQINPISLSQGEHLILYAISYGFSKNFRSFRWIISNNRVLNNILSVQMRTEQLFHLLFCDFFEITVRFTNKFSFLATVLSRSDTNKFPSSDSMTN